MACGQHFEGQKRENLPGMKRQLTMKTRVQRAAAILALAGVLPGALVAASAAGRKTLTPAFVQARFAGTTKFSHLKPGDTLQGKVLHNVYFGTRLAIPQGSGISMAVSRLERRRRKPFAVVPWPVQYFLPKYKKYPAFDFADVVLPGGARMRLRVVSVSTVKHVHATLEVKRSLKSGERTAAKKAKPAKRHPRTQSPTYEVVVDQNPGLPPQPARLRGSVPQIQTASAGTEAELALVGSLSASKSRTGEPFKALLIEPLRLPSNVTLPEGTVFEGYVAKRTPARRLSRSGSLYLTFDHVMLPAGTSLPIAASVAEVGVDQGSQLHVSSEGRLKGGSPGKKRLLIELGVGYGLSKVADDTYQLIVEAFISTATDASTAGTARLIGLGFTGVYWLTRRGRDVSLPPYTILKVRFDRTPTLEADALP